MPTAQVIMEGRTVGARAPPSTTGAAIAGGIIFGVFFLVALAAMFYYGYHHQHPSLDTPTASPTRIDIWTGRLGAFLQPVPGDVAAYTNGDRSVNAHRRPSLWAAVRSPAVMLHRPPPAFTGPPPPYDPDCLPEYEEHELGDMRTPPASGA
ncbi:hypothetical protein FKP32DRAFT_435066 [Trametes sanguinea]|nr:hypothetical protein FKP32DRAFT_435066 [Trametes sanguinea]